jgi:hypothetical protein
MVVDIKVLAWFCNQQSLVKTEKWQDIVTIVSCDMRSWTAPEKADILVRTIHLC